MIVDTHTHIYLPEFGEDLEAVVSRAVASGIGHFVLPNVDTETIAPLREVREKYPCLMSSAMGLHPTSVNDTYKPALDAVYKELCSGDYCGVGEIGLDLYWDKTYYKQQTDVFVTQLKWAAEKDLPVIIHCRDAFDEIIEVFDRLKQIPVRGVFHSFGGTPEQVEKVKGAGDFYFGINGVATFKNAHLENTVRAIGLSRLLLETDAPYLAPVPYRGKRNEPAYLVRTAEKMASVFGIEESEIEETTTRNAVSLFRLQLKVTG